MTDNSNDLASAGSITLPAVSLADGVYDAVVIKDGKIVNASGPIPVCTECGAAIREPISHSWECPLDLTMETGEGS